MMPSMRVPQPCEPSTGLVSVDIRSVLGVGPAPALMTLLISASLTLMLLRLLLLGALTCLPGRSLTVRVGEGERDLEVEGAVTMTTDWSSERSVSDCWSPRWITGRGFSSLGLFDGAENTSAVSAGAGTGPIRAASLGNGGTGGGKASNRGELE